MKLNFSQLAAMGLSLGALCSCSSTKQRIDYSWFSDTLTAAQEDSVNVEAGEGLAEALPAAEASEFTPPTPTPPATTPTPDTTAHKLGWFSQQQSAPDAAQTPSPASTTTPAQADTTRRKSKWFSQLQPAPAATDTTPQGTYMVQKGDVLSVIARRHRVSTAALARANNLANPNALRIGQVLTIPRPGLQTATAAPQPVATPQPVPAQPPAAATPAAPAPQAAVGNNYYTVCAGDTLARIARRYNTSISKIMQANSMTEAQANRLQIGQRILLPRN